MTRGRTRSLIPPAYAALDLWARPDEAQLSGDTLTGYQRNRLAVEMYAANVSTKDIREATGKGAREVRRLVKRCIKANGSGGVLGFYALIPNTRIEPYTRTAPVEHDEGGGRGGCAGALRQLFDRLPEVEELVAGTFFKRWKGAVAEARISFMTIHAIFKDALRKLGFTDQQWPFNTAIKGYNALRQYCIDLMYEALDRWVGVRHGTEAQRRGRVGRGPIPFLPLLRFGGGMILDYLKIDCQTVFLFVNAYGDEIPLVLPRWHVGLMVEERSRLIVGVCIALETTPSGDNCLETVESALRPMVVEPGDPLLALVVDGKFLPNQLLSELAWQGFAWLKVDNGWANAATEVVNNIMDVTGCAVNFGPVRSWVRRWLIERINGEITRRGAQRLPSTYGTGPADTRRDKPAEQAVKLQIRMDEVVSIICAEIRRYNEFQTEGLQFSSPLSAMRNAIRNRGSGWLPQPLPRREQADLRLLYHVEVHRILGDITQHDRPYVNILNERYTCERLAADYSLVGKRLVCYVDRRDPSRVTATVQETGEDIGALRGSGRWRGFKICYRDRYYLMRGGRRQRFSQEGVDTVTRWTARKKEEISGRSKRKSTKYSISRDGHRVARVMQGSPTEPPAPPDAADLSDHDEHAEARVTPATPATPSDPFGMDQPINLTPHDREASA